MTFVLLLVYTAVFVWMILRFRFFKIQGIRRVYILLAFVLKLLAGAALSALYSGHYDDRTTGDTYRFFDDATVMYSSLFEEETPETYLRLLFGIDEKTDPLAKKYYYTMTHMERPFGVGFFNDNITIIKANAFLMLFSGGYYPTHVLFWCFMSLIGLTALMRLLVVYFPRKKWAMFFAVYLLPTTVFWTSGVLKDGLLILGFGLFLRGFFHFIYGDFERRHFPGLLIGLALLIFVKGYVLFCMAPPLIGLLLAKLTHGRRFWLVFSIPHVLALLLVFLGGHLHPELNVAEKFRLKQEAFYNVAAGADAGSIIDIPTVEKPVDIVLGAPEALVVTYLRPWIWEGGNPLYIPAGLENLLLLIVLAVMIWNFRPPYGLILPIVAFCAGFVLILGVLIGETVPVLGAVVRYKVPALILLFVLIFALTDHVHLQRRLPVLRRFLRRL